MTPAEEMAAIRDRHLGELEQLRRDHVAISGALFALRNSVKRRRDIVRIHDQLADITLNGGDLAGRFEGLGERVRQQSLRDAVSGFERFASDAFRARLGSGGGAHVSERRMVSVGELRAAPDLKTVLERVVAEAADQKLADLMYGSPAGWFKFIGDHFGHQVMAHDRADFAEKKATRNALEHAGGVVGEQYLEAVRKLNGTPRGAVGDRLVVDPVYLNDAFALVHRLIGEVGAAAVAAAPT